MTDPATEFPAQPVKPTRRWRRRAATSLGILALLVSVLAFVTTSGCASFGGTSTGARRERVEAAPQWAGDQFKNEVATEVMAADGAWKTSLEFFWGGNPYRVPTCELPMQPDISKYASPPASGLRITWFGHSGSLIEIDGKRILTDPMWSERASPSTIVGPKRFHPVAIALADLPPIDVVLISHDHYDHLDMETVKALAKRGATFYVALGVGAHLERWGIDPSKIVEHTWWQEDALGDGVTVISTPARHFSGRGLIRNKTLWTSWTIVGPKHRVFFSGDTGLGPHFKAVGDKFGPFDVAMLEVGQWNRAWGSIHLGPLGAMQAFADLNARQLLPIHWSTFELGLHAWSEPPETVVKLAAAVNAEVITPMIGEPFEPIPGVKTPRWWRALPPSTESCPAPGKTAQRD